MKFFLAGYYGFGNLGDELLCETTKKILRQINAEVTVLDRSQRKILKIIKHIKACDVLLFGGGSLLQDVTGRGLTVLFYYLVVKLAKIFRKKVFFVAQGIGPVTRSINHWLVKRCLQQADYISVRNKESAAFLLALGITRYQVFNDLFFAADVETLSIKKDPIKKISIVFSFRYLKKDYGQQLYRLMKRIRDVLKYIKITVVPMQEEADEKFLKVLRKLDDVEVIKYNRQKIFEAINQADLAVGMRYHFLMLAAKYNVPFVGIAYDPKILGICKSLNMPTIALSQLDTIGNELIKEIAKIKIRKNDLRNSLKREEKIAKAAVVDLQKALQNVAS